MKDYKRITLSGVAAASLLMGGAAPMFTADIAQAEETVSSTSSLAGSKDAADASGAQASEGEFSWDQATVTPNWRIASLFRNAVANLCGSVADFSADNPLGWKLRVTGDVRNEFTATVDDMASEESVEDLMSCTCGSNPADGAAIVTADVKGIPVTYLLERADANDGANTITFVSSDGFEQAMPLGYVIGRHGVISYEINGEDLSASVVIPQARSVGFEGYVMGPDGYDGLKLTGDKSQYNKTYYTTHYSADDNTNTKVQDFIKSYKSKNNAEPNTFAALGYDTIYMIKQAIEKAGKNATREDVRNAVAGMTFDGVTGKFTMDKSGSPTKSVTVLEMKDGKPVYNTTVQPK